MLLGFVLSVDAIRKRNPGLTEDELAKRIKEETEQQPIKPKMIKCPGCDLEFPEDDLHVQMKHMDQYHPEIIAERRRGL